MAPYGQDELELLEASVLDSLEHFYMKNVAKELMQAFIERWQPETKSFHMTWGEMTITLHDVAFILELCVDGLAVVYGDSVEERPMCELLLAKVFDLDLVEAHAKLDNSRIKWSEFVQCVRSRSRSCRQKLVGFLTFLIAVLAHLYRQLGSASRAHVKGLQGYTLPLQCWIYEYFRPLRAPINPDYREMQPHFLKWKPRKGISDSFSVRRMLDGTHADQFMEIIEPYMPDRVLRQFRFRQTIPQCYIHSREPCLRGPLGGQKYQVPYDPPGEEWMDLTSSSITLEGRT
ncbi:PREDICTED: serine/threonine-protein phosphatase 7 long form homolog [Erythranthe guttata]|uniref:serine/threonine-protein phosphatase 7 long form homolog n=1 Tax=Erythranthe guttata TaxID=4155 RepID=UPI00064DFCDD|nr:PREDICTED: serine/threonine-protein phosphatase 7 long form homolog [Erythranthe guttata]|eukprot:XP_012837641.1 PREDICTED: serine/threonine-protein phosphatase 7 long form homolog [Erythranthe guttata]